jgi:hypothetical protein
VAACGQGNRILDSIKGGYIPGQPSDSRLTFLCRHVEIHGFQGAVPVSVVIRSHWWHSVGGMRGLPKVLTEHAPLLRVETCYSVHKSKMCRIVWNTKFFLLYQNFRIYTVLTKAEKITWSARTGWARNSWRLLKWNNILRKMERKNIGWGCWEQMSRKIFGSKTEEVTEGRRKVHDKELHDL